MNLRTIKRKTQAAMAAAVVVELRVPVGMTAFTVLRIVQSMTRNRISGALRRNDRGNAHLTAAQEVEDGR